MEQRFKPLLAITMGDPAGIGAEIAVKAFLHPERLVNCLPVVIGDRAAMEDALHFTGADLKLQCIQDPSEVAGAEKTIYLMDLGLLQLGDWAYKKVAANTGEASYRYIERGIQLAMAGKIHGVVTGPINKESLNMAGHHYSGHTEIFATLTNTKSYAMLLTAPTLNVIHATTHVSMLDACKRITESRVYDVIHLAEEAMHLLGVAEPCIGVAGLNAHCSENGLFGSEEAASIIPAIARCQQEGLNVVGPVPPDTVFVKAISGVFDIVVAMYHDQGHIPVKLVGFKMDPATNRYSSVSGVNITIGLPIIRTSVDHGTAYGKAGEGRANEESLIDAIEKATIMANNKFAK